MAEKITKTEAVRRALAELGNDAMPVAIQGWVKDKLDVEMTAGHVSTTKGQLLRDAAKEKEAPVPAAPAASEAQPAKLTKNEAVRLALVELGKEASRVEIQGFVKERFGIEMNLDHVSTARSIALHKLAQMEGAATAPAVPTPQPASTSEAASKVSEATITKYEAVRRALDELGKNAKVKDIQSFLKKHFNIEITAGHAKTNKGKILNEGKKKTAAKKPAPVEPTAAPAPKAQPSAAKPAPAPGAGKLIHLADIQTLKALVQRVGRETLQTLISVMAK